MMQAHAVLDLTMCSIVYLVYLGEVETLWHLRGLTYRLMHSLLNILVCGAYKGSNIQRSSSTYNSNSRNFIGQVVQTTWL